MNPASEEADSPPLRPFLVIITGEPGTGKTTLGRELAAMLRLPFLSRDDVRGGLLATAGMWSGHINSPTSRQAARTTFVQVVEAVARFGVSAVLEFIPFRDDPTTTQRLITAGDCLVVLTTCDAAPARAERRDRADRLLNRDSVLAALGLRSVEDYLRDQERKAVAQRMYTPLDVPLLEVGTDDGYEPPLDEIVDWIIDRTRR